MSEQYNYEKDYSLLLYRSIIILSALLYLRYGNYAPENNALSLVLSTSIIISLSEFYYEIGIQFNQRLSKPTLVHMSVILEFIVLNPILICLYGICSSKPKSHFTQFLKILIPTREFTFLITVIQSIIISLVVYNSLLTPGQFFNRPIQLVSLPLVFFTALQLTNNRSMEH